jgi:7-cyano-7-deazaguanine synthase
MPSTHPGKAVVLLSGGIDSATSLVIAGAEGYEIHALTFDYHQRHARELASARQVAAVSGVTRHLVIAFDLRDIGGSALTSDMKVPKKRVRSSVSGFGKKAVQTPNPQPPIPVTYVPARNTIFLSFALGWAEVLEAEHIFIGANAIDYSGYPDCRPEYLRSFEQMANLATKASVEGALRFRIEAPLISLTKAEIIRKGLELGLDYGLTWSCYDPQPASGHGAKGAGQGAGRKTADKKLLAQYIPCGRCDSCMLRQKGFSEAGIEDPLLS